MKNNHDGVGALKTQRKMKMVTETCLSVEYGALICLNVKAFYIFFLSIRTYCLLVDVC